MSTLGRGRATRTPLAMARELAIRSRNQQSLPVEILLTPGISKIYQVGLGKRKIRGHK